MCSSSAFSDRSRSRSLARVRRSSATASVAVRTLSRSSCSPARSRASALADSSASLARSASAPARTAAASSRAALTMRSASPSASAWIRSASARLRRAVDSAWAVAAAAAATSAAAAAASADAVPADGVAGTAEPAVDASAAALSPPGSAGAAWLPDRAVLARSGRPAAGGLTVEEAVVPVVGADDACVSRVSFRSRRSACSSTAAVGRPRRDSIQMTTASIATSTADKITTSASMAHLPRSSPARRRERRAGRRVTGTATASSRRHFHGRNDLDRPASGDAERTGPVINGQVRQSV